MSAAMMMRRLFVFGLALLTADAEAAMPPVPALPIMKPVIDPAMPTVATPVTVYFRSGTCQYIWDTPTQAELVRNGEALDLVIDGGVSYGIDCTATSGVVHFDIGTLPAGAYRLRIVLREEGYPTVTWPYDETATDFVVAEAHQVPAGNAATFVLLALALAAVAASARRSPG